MRLFKLKLLIMLMLFMDSNAIEVAKSYSYDVHKRIFPFSTEFEIEYEGEQFACALKSMFHVRTQYDLFDFNGEHDGQGVHSLFPSWGVGWFFSWASDIDVYDRTGNYIGMIDGLVITDAFAKFNFVDAAGETIAVAYMDRKRDSFVIADPKNSSRKIAELTRNYLKFHIDYWTIRIFDDTVIPKEMLQIFAIFACDRQDSFNPVTANR